MEEILLFTIILLQCVPESPTRGVIAVQNELILNCFFVRNKGKKTLIYWEVASKCNPNFETSTLLSQQKQAQDYMHAWQKRDFSRISNVWRLYANSRRHNMIVISACCLKRFCSMGFSSKWEECIRQTHEIHCSEDHLCAYHNHSYTGNVLPHCKQGRIYEVRFHRQLSSFLDYCLFRNTKYIFCKSFSPVILTLQKVLKEILQHRSAHTVFVVQCAIWTKVVFAHISARRQQHFWMIMNFAFRSKKRWNPDWLHHSSMFVCLETFCDCRIICQQNVQVIKGLFSRRCHEHTST